MLRKGVRGAGIVGRQWHSARAMSGIVDGKEKLVIFDTTLRDGEQSPGATLNFREKLDIARHLSLMGVDVCEAGFPIASPGDFDAVKAIAEQIGPLETNRVDGPMRICGLSRATKKDIERCYLAVSPAPRNRIHTFLATSDIHLEHKLKISRDECVKRAVEAVQFASSMCEDIEFSPEDAGRSDPAFLAIVLAEVIKAGATTLNIPDTVGYTTPAEYGGLFKYLIENTEGSEKAIWSTHCHNDLGLATANTLAAVENGARQVEVTVNGIGERAGNTALEEVIMTLSTRPALYPVYSNIKTQSITRASHMVSSLTGMAVQPNKAIVGANAFAHEAGIHQDGMLKNASTYEIMTPESVGLKGHSGMVLGKHSGKHAYSKRLEELGFSDLTDAELNEFVEKFKILADEKKEVTDADIITIASDKLYASITEDKAWTLVSIHVTAGKSVKPTATVELKSPDGSLHSEASLGTGPIDAVYQAISRATNIRNELADFSVKSITEGKRALGEVTIRVQRQCPTALGKANEFADARYNPQTGVSTRQQHIGRGSDTDIIVASANAYIQALNKLESFERYEAKKEREGQVRDPEAASEAGSV